MGDSPKWVKSKKQREKKKGEKERLNDGDNNGQATHGARKPPGLKMNTNTQGTAGGLGGRFSHMGVFPKWIKSRRRRKKKEERGEKV